MVLEVDLTQAEGTVSTVDADRGTVSAAVPVNYTVIPGLGGIPIKLWSTYWAWLHWLHVHREWYLPFCTPHKRLWVLLLNLAHTYKLCCSHTVKDYRYTKTVDTFYYECEKVQHAIWRKKSRLLYKRANHQLVAAFRSVVLKFHWDSDFIGDFKSEIES